MFCGIRDIKKIIVVDKKELLCRVFESKYYYNTYKDILYVGNYLECIEFIRSNSNLQLELTEIID